MSEGFEEKEMPKDQEFAGIYPELTRIIVPEYGVHTDTE